MPMNAWITQQASVARADDLRHAAAIDRLAQEIGAGDRRRGEHPVVARMTGEILLRAGRRLAGDQCARTIVSADNLTASGHRG
jgi:hypothetical protein